MIIMGLPSISVINERFLEPAEAGAGIGCAVFDTQRLEDIRHEIGAWTRVIRDFDDRSGFRFQGGLLRECDRRGSGQARGTGGAFQKTSAIDRVLRFFVHSASCWGRPESGHLSLCHE
jgi:hypothetical protein